MPCWTVQENTLDLANVNADLLWLALEGLGYHVYDFGSGRAIIHADHFGHGSSVVFEGGQLKVTTSRVAREELVERTNEVRRAYAAQAVKAAAQRFGWRVTETAPGKLRAQRRA